MGIRTFFNILGPLINPAAAPFQVIGIYDPSLLEVVAKALLDLGIVGAMVVHGNDGLDEITMTGPTTVFQVTNGLISREIIDPKEFGFQYCSPEDLLGGSPKENAIILESILDGETSPRTDIVIVNAAAALKTTGKYATWMDAITAAKKSIHTGSAMATLKKLRNVCPI